MRSFLILSIICVTLASPLHADQLTNLVTGNAEPEDATEEKRVIEVDSTEHDDKKIRRRLQKIFSEMENLRNLDIMVSNGIVTLIGDVNSSSAESKALMLSQQVEGVVEVKNKLVVTHDLKDRLETTWQKLEKNIKELITSIPVLLLAILTFALSWIFGRWLSHHQRLFQKIAPNPFIANLLGQVTHLLFILTGLVLALSLLDLTALIGTILGAAGIVGLAIGFAVRDTVENYIASILLSLRNPFETNDLVNIDGSEGNVIRLTTRATILLSLDGNHIRIPNSIVFKAVIINYTRNPERRFQFDVGIDSGQDLLEAQKIALQNLATIDGVLSEPKPMILIEELGDSSIVVRIYGWMNQKKYSFLKVRSEAIRQIKHGFDQANIVMPEPIHQVKILNETLKDLTKFNNLKKDEAPQTDSKKKAFVHAVTDTSSDNTIREKVEKEKTQIDAENLLDNNASLE